MKAYDLVFTRSEMLLYFGIFPNAEYKNSARMAALRMSNVLGAPE